MKLGRCRVAFRISDIEEWIQARLDDPTSNGEIFSLNRVAPRLPQRGVFRASPAWPALNSDTDSFSESVSQNRSYADANASEVIDLRPGTGIGIGEIRITTSSQAEDSAAIRLSEGAPGIARHAPADPDIGIDRSMR